MKKKEDGIYINHINPKDWKKKISKKKLAIAILFLIIIIAIITMFCIYAFNENVRTSLDKKMIFKNVEEDNLPYINTENLGDYKIFAWADTIGIIHDRKITKYDSIGKSIAEINIEISNPLVVTNDEYAVIAEKNGTKLYLLKRNNILWEKDFEGQITRINVNSNGYISVVLTGTMYKSVIELYNESGDELFKTYLSSTMAVNTSISDDNKYLAFAEVNMAGTMVQSNIKVISIDKAKKKESSTDAILYTYSANPNDLIIDINYQNRDKLVCIYDTSIHVIENESDKELIKFDENNKDNSFADIKLNNYIMISKEKREELFDHYTEISFINTFSNRTNTYNLESTIKSVEACKDKVGINTGKEIYFIGDNGWLIKKYVANTEVKELIMSNSIAGIVYKNKIELIKL